MHLPRNILLTAFVGRERVFWSGSDLVFHSHQGAKVVIPARFLSDGLSIPRLFQNVFSKSPHYIYAGILHDYTYRKDFPHPMTRRQADKLFLHYMKQYGVGFFTRHTIYRAVRLGAWMNWKKRNAEYHST